MNCSKQIVTFLFLLVSTYNYAQLGFCNGSKGDPVFTENFGNGTNYGPALPAGVTNYTFITGNPNDGFYTLYYRTNLYSTWHYSLDHTPDITNGPNGKALIVNADASTSGDFYKRTVTGLCVNTTFEFSAWLMNIYNPGSGFCGAGEIPINVRFEIWDVTETFLLGSGNTGNIIGTPAPLWRQFALVFTTTSQTSVVLKMKNNGLGGCGNDLAIDDIEFRACGDLTTITSPSAVANDFATCQNPVSIQLQANTSGGSSTHFYQWQQSTDGTTWTDILGANNAIYVTPNLTVQTYFRTKVAQDVVNLNNSFCSTLSNIFTVSFLATPNNCVSNGDVIICSNQSIPALSVVPDSSSGVNWYSASTGGTLLQSNSTSYTPTAPGTFYAEAYNLTTNCISNARTPVSLTIVPLPTASISGTTSICSGNSTTISFNGTPNAIITYTVNSGSNQTITLNSSGLASITTPILTSNSTYTLVSCASPVLNSCVATLNASAVITVGLISTATISGTTSICSGNTAQINFNGTPNAVVTYTIDGGSNQTITLNSSGTASVTTPVLNTNSTYTLVSSVSSGPSSCTAMLTGSAIITVIATPTASISGTTTICSGNSSTISFNGTPNAIVTYTVNGGSNQTITLNTSGVASFTTPVLNSNSTYTLVSCTSPLLSSCLTTLNGSAIITVNPIPTVIISGAASICSGTSTPINFSGTPNAIVTYTINGGSNQTITLNSSGVASLTTPILSSNTTYTLVSSISSVSSTCVATLTGSATITVIPIPTATISGTTTICSGNSTIISFNGTPNAIVTYTVDGGSNQTITLNSSGGANVTTPILNSNSTYTLVSCASSILSSCNTTYNSSVQIMVNPIPTATITGTSTICSGSNTTLTFNGTPNAIVTYTVNNGANQTVTLTGGQAIITTANLTSNTFYSLVNVAATGTNTCSQALSQSYTISVVPLPLANITASPSTVCSGETSTLNFSGTPNAVITYSINGSSNATITLNSFGLASVTTSNLTTNTNVQLTNVSTSGTANCSQSLSNSVLISINPTPTASYNGLLNYCSNETTNIGLTSSIVGTTYTWTVVQNGTSGASSGSGNLISQQLITTTNIDGTAIYSVTPFYNGCQGTVIQIPITIHTIPNPTISNGVICLSNSNTSSQPYTLMTNLSAAEYTFVWYFEGNSIPNAFGNTYDAYQIGNYSVEATNIATGCVSDLVTVTVTESVKGESLIINQSAAFSDFPTITVTVVGGQGPFLYQLDDLNFQSSNVFYPATSGTHTITVVDESYCTNLFATVTLINYPHYFTPNNDGFNDTWNVKGVGDNSRIFIFDRYGKLLKQISTGGSGWDGTYNGRLLVADDYWFVLDYVENQVQKTFKAHFTLKR